jgi:ketosteroid isomerase-like protein
MRIALFSAEERKMRNRALPIIVLTLSAVAVAFGLSACAKAPEPQVSAAPAVAKATPAEDVEATITQLEKDWVAAIQKKDTATLDRLLAPDFVGTSPTAHTYMKENAIEDIKDARYVVERMDLDEISVNVYGTTAVSFTSQEEKSKYEGKDTSGHYHFTDVWVKGEGGWKVVASHGTRFDKASASEKSKAK